MSPDPTPTTQRTKVAPYELARQLRRRSVAVDHAATWAQAAWSLREDPVIVFSLGKTGTSSLTRAIEQQADRTVLKAHVLRPASVRRRTRRRDKTGGHRPRFQWRTQVLSARMLVPHRRGRWQVIAAVRDPIARLASAYFYNHRHETIGSTDEVAAGVRTLLETVALGEDFFEDEFEPITSIDVYATAFDHSEGWARYTNANFDVVVLRTEDLPRIGPIAVQQLLDLATPIEVGRQNEGTASHGSAYETHLGQLRFDAGLVERVYDTRIARHFYSDDERKALIDRWTP